LSKRKSWLIADIGATTSRCATLHIAGGDMSEPRIYRNDDFAGITELLAEYLLTAATKPDCCALAVAAPILGNVVPMINRDWQFDSNTLADELGFGEIKILNDFHAIAHALPYFDNSTRYEIGQVTDQRSGNIAVLGPGSGLGMAAWIGSGENGAAMCGEGGHITVAGRNTNEDSIIEKLRQRFGHCSAERILSGPGLIALHEAMHGIGIATSEEITGNQSDTKCAETLQQFFAFLGGIAADLALITGSFGGVYIAGGIVPACIEQLISSDFRSRFEDKNRYCEYMQSIPTYVITDPYPGLSGLSAYVNKKNVVKDI